MYKKTFIEDGLNGDASPSNLDDYIEYWHTHDTESTLQEFLGMTDYEFELWGKSSDTIVGDIFERRYVYCTHCENFKIIKSEADDEIIPYCPFSNECGFYDFEDSRPSPERPMYKPNAAE